MKLIVFLLFIVISLQASIQFNTSKIKNYKVIKEFYSQNKNKFMAIRSYEYNSKRFYLLIDLDTLKTSIITQDEKKNLKKTDESLLLKTNYLSIREKALANRYIMANAGINESIQKYKNEVYLTIDMCPSSKKAYEKELFEKFLKSKDKNKKIPISIAITYRWVKAHKNEFSSLIENQNLDITWINHSKNHYYNPFEKLSNNFMLNSKTDLKEEIIEVEKMLIINNQTPSILFRFPGLISSEKLINFLIKEFSLIPLGTNNWLVKSKKKIDDGDIVLIHGNLNEKEGVEMLIKNQDSLKRFKPIYNSLLTK